MRYIAYGCIGHRKIPQSNVTNISQTFVNIYSSLHPMIRLSWLTELTVAAVFISNFTILILIFFAVAVADCNEFKFVLVDQF